MAINLMFKNFLIMGTFINTIMCSNTNLTSVKWDHAVNTQQKLNESFRSDVDMIEADIVLGTLINGTGEIIPIMCHPPLKISDISLKSFLTQILEFNIRNVQTKGVKLDFKSTEVFNGSLDILKGLWDLMTYPVWINADIIPGPVNNNYTIPVDPDLFFSGCKQFPNATLSVGWTTNWGSTYKNGIYTDEQINFMINSIKSNNITHTGNAITFPVRAGIASNSNSQIQKLFSSLNKTNSVTITIWSSRGDYVDIPLLRKLIFDIGLDKVYLDVPEEVSSHLNLGKGNNTGKLDISKMVLLLLLVVSLSIGIFFSD